MYIINKMFGSSIRQNGESQTPQGGFDHEKDGVKSNIIRGFGCQEISWLNHLLNKWDIKTQKLRDVQHFVASGIHLDITKLGGICWV